tara:strand:+ start:2549 stop:2734 length:186 start_codon:yes stop_codon:yes gene_type:complete
MKAVINKNKNFGTLDGVITENKSIRKMIYTHLKSGTAKLIVDNDETLMYNLLCESTKSNVK